MESKTANDLEVFESKSSVEDYIALLKPRVMLLAVFTSLCGLCLAPVSIHPFMFVLSIFCISLGAGAAGAINMWFDRDIDSLMERTKKRPIPVGKIDADNALGFGIMLSVISVLMLGLSLNYLAACLLAFSIFFYIFIYTIWLKRRTPQNIVIGGIAGSTPPLIGWAAAAGDSILESMNPMALGSPIPWLFFALIYVAKTSVDGLFPFASEYEYNDIIMNA